MPRSDPGCLVLPPGTNIGLESLLELCGDQTCVIFDRDNAGELLRTVETFVAAKPKPPDLVALFSCREGELMPRSMEYPSDIFTACLTTPARVALTWHSRHYFCFSSGPLQPLSQFFVEEMSADPERKAKMQGLFDHVMMHLKAAVETMALNVMEKDIFVKLFRLDPTVSRLSINFVLAMRILGCFGVHPVSYPAVPDLCDAPEWHTFDLALDVVLYMLTTDQPNDRFISQHHFLSQTLDSMKNFVDLACVEDERPFELSFFPEILVDPDLCDSACCVLAKYLDSSPAAIDHCLYFAIPKALFEMLTARHVTSALLFCLIKLLSYSRDIRASLYEQSNRVIEEILIPEAQGKNQNLIFVLLSLLFKDCGAIFKQMIMNTEALRDIDPPSYQGDAKKWALFAVSSAVPYLRSVHLVEALLDRIVLLADEADTEMQIVLISALSKFIKDGNIRGETMKAMKQRKKIEKTAVETGLKFASSTSFITRRELFLLIEKYRQKNKENVESSTKPFYEKIRNFRIKCSNDPYPSVRETVRSAAVSEEIQHSTILDGYHAMLLSPVINLVTDPALSFVSLFDSRKEQIRNEPRISSPDPCEQTCLKFFSCYRHVNPVSTNLEFFSENRIAFGDKVGSLCIKTWGDESLLSALKLTTAPLTDVHYLSNCGNPLMLATDATGSCYCAALESNFHLSLTGAFTALPTRNPGHVHFAVAEWPMIMYSYTVGGEDFYRRDLRSDRLLPSIKPKNGPTISLQTFDHFSDYVGVCGTGFEFYDLRASTSNPMFEVELFSPAFGVKVMDPVVPVVAIATDQAAVGRLDLRYPAGIRTSALLFSPEQTEQQMKAFAVHQRAETAAISHAYGVTCVHIYNGRQEVVPLLPRMQNHVPNATALVYHESRYSLAFVHDLNHIVTVV